ASVRSRKSAAWMMPALLTRDVEIAEGAAGFVDRVRGACGVADVGGEETRIAEVARGGLAGGGVDVGDGDARPLRGVVPGNRKPNAVRGAGHDRNLVLEPHGVLWKLSIPGELIARRRQPA